MAHQAPSEDQRTTFQVERIAFFSDAVFAIAITLMVIEVKPPHLHAGDGSREAFSELLHMLPLIMGTLLSFFLISLFWYKHHQLMRHMGTYDTGFIIRNMTHLAAVVFIPFTTAFVSANLTVHTPVPFILYNLNYIVATYTNYRLFRYALDERNGLCDIPWPGERRHLHRKLLFPIGVFALIIVLSLLHPSIASMAYALLGFEKPILRLFERKASTEKGTEAAS
jgi:uncharacterized membrane protein